MKKIILFLCLLILPVPKAFASQSFIFKEKGALQEEGDCDKPYAPMSTFKIVLGLIGYDTGILKNETDPLWPFQEGYVDWRDDWKKDQTPRSWIKESCVWYSQELTKKLGMEKFQDYVTKFSYGNRDLSGDQGQNNGLTNAWLSSSLAISPREQIAFLEKMVEGLLPVNPRAVEMTKKLFLVEEGVKEGWTLYGKTGMGSVLNPDGIKDPALTHGWFVGWAEKDHRRFFFVNHIVDEKKEALLPSVRAREDTIKRLRELIDKK